MIAFWANALNFGLTDAGHAQAGPVLAAAPEEHGLHEVKGSVPSPGKISKKRYSKLKCVFGIIKQNQNTRSCPINLFACIWRLDRVKSTSSSVFASHPMRQDGRDITRLRLRPWRISVSVWVWGVRSRTFGGSESCGRVSVCSTLGAPLSEVRRIRSPSTSSR